MKSADMMIILKNTPTYAPVFKIVKVPDWAKDHVDYNPRLVVGDEFVFDTRKGLRCSRNGYYYNIGSTYLEFVEYRKIG
jgi:hypothetical protein